MTLFEQVDLIGTKFWSVHPSDDDYGMLREHTIIKTDNLWLYYDKGSKILLEDYKNILNKPRHYYDNRYIFDSKKEALNHLLDRLDAKYSETEQAMMDIRCKRSIIRSKLKFAETMLYDTV